MMEVIGKVRRGLRKPPHVIAKRIQQEVLGYAERYLAPQRVRRLTCRALLKKTQQQTLPQLWDALRARPYVACTDRMSETDFEALCPGEKEVLLARANEAMLHRVNLLGSGWVSLGANIDWHRDYKSGFDWPLAYIRDIDYNNPDRPSDVKFPWEVSRLQWLMPVGQAYQITGDEKYAEAVKAILSSWIQHNPYAQGVNWACTMEVALRIVSWTWFFHVFKDSQAWQDRAFQQSLLTCLFLHAEFTSRHLEFSDINGNHYTADAAGLVFAGLFFGEGACALRWQTLGWDILNQELPRQVFEDGVDFEASVPYHRLVLELFFLPALYREKQGLSTPVAYRERLTRMAEFTASYQQPDGSVPLFGDADDARTLPFGRQSLHDHRYLCGFVGQTWHHPTLLAYASGSLGEHVGLFGVESARALMSVEKATENQSQAFVEGGFYIMQNQCDHVFIDCGPLGLAGRGGHGHNDCLAFEAVLCGVKLVSDCGAYVYTASYSERQAFRSTPSHNTPCVDGQEINRFMRHTDLWTLHDDAKPHVERWETSTEQDVFCGTHSGYQRLADPVTPKRTVVLNHADHLLTVQDEILCQGCHEVSIPWYLAPNVSVSETDDPHTYRLSVDKKVFMLVWEGGNIWQAQIMPARISPSYGVVVPSQKVVWQASIQGNTLLKVRLFPEGEA